jgi:hypothetical protein
LQNSEPSGIHEIGKIGHKDVGTYAAATAADADAAAAP